MSSGSTPDFLWHLAVASEDPALARGEAPPGLLSPGEELVLAGLPFPLRRRKWLLGRVAAKRVVAAVLSEHGGAIPPPARIVVDNDALGAPSARIEGGEALSLRLSISHRDGWGCAAVARREGLRLGIDLETVEPRDLALARTFFTDAETAAVAAANGRAADLVLARTWSAKEAVLKALGVGLRRDTRLIAVDGETTAPAPAGWRALAVTVAPDGEGTTGQPQPTVLWRDEGAYVLTIALLA